MSGLIASLSSIVPALFESPELLLNLVLAGGRLLTVTATVTEVDFGESTGPPSLAAEFSRAPLAKRDVSPELLTQRLRAPEVLTDLEHPLRSLLLALPQVLFVSIVVLFSGRAYLGKV